MTAYWIGLYREILDADRLAAYAELAGPAITRAGGTFLARGLPAECFEAGIPERSVLIRFESVEAAQAAYHSVAYQAALHELGDGAIRDVRIVSASRI